MSLDELLCGLAARSVELFLAGDRLRYRAPKGALDADLRNQIAAYRLAIIEHLQAAKAAAGERQRCGICDRRDWVDEQPKDSRIRTNCRKCGGFIGYRPAHQRTT